MAEIARYQIKSSETPFIVPLIVFWKTVFFGLLLSVTTYTWAVCDAELEDFITVAERPEFGTKPPPRTTITRGHTDLLANGMWATSDIEQFMRSREDSIQKAERAYRNTAPEYRNKTNGGLGSLLWKAQSVYELCMAKWEKERRGSSANRAGGQNRQGSASTPSTQSNDTAQQAEQQLQAAATQAQTRAREAQQRGDADAQRRGRRMHDPAAEAHECIRPIFTGLYGAFENTCNQQVNYTFCAFRPKQDSWLTSMDCEKQQFGSWQVGANRQATSHTKGAESIHWFACKEPAWSLDHSFDGSQIQGRCRVVGGN
jgi:hypothetical protein